MDFSELPKTPEDCPRHRPECNAFRGTCPILSVDPETMGTQCCGWFRARTKPVPFPEYRENMETTIGDLLAEPARICITRMPEGTFGPGGCLEYYADYFDAKGHPSESRYGGDTWQEAVSSMAAAPKAAEGGSDGK